MADNSQSGMQPTKPPFWNDPKIRAIVFQVLVALAVVFFFYYIIQNTLHNLEVRGISTGFSFLSNPAGFSIIQSLIDYSPASTYGRTFVVGLLNTVLVSVLGIILATLLGFIMGVARLSTNWLIARLAAAYIEIFRNIPLLLQILFWYFAVFLVLPPPRQSLAIGETVFLNQRGLYLPAPVFESGFMWTGVALAAAIVGVVFLARWARERRERTGQPFHTFYVSLALLVVVPSVVFLASGRPMTWDVPALHGFNFRGGVTVIPELTALLLALTIYTGTFIAETVRSGIQAVSHGQTEAAHALGLRPGPTLRLVVIPQAMRVIIPPLTSQYLNLLKNSSLATAIGYPDLMSLFAGTTLNQTGQAVEVMAMTMAVYLTVSLAVSLLMNWYNAKMALVER